MIKYSGRSSDRNFEKHYQILRTALKKDKIFIHDDPPIMATYDAPYTLPIFRRNEAMFNVKFIE